MFFHVNDDFVFCKISYLKTYHMGLYKHCQKKKCLGCLGTSLVVQWLRLPTPNAGAQVQSLVRELDLTC